MKQPLQDRAYNARITHENFHDLAALRAFADHLIQSWDRDRGRPFKMKSEYATASGPVIWSFTQHVVELTRTILDLSRQNRMIVAVPLIRLALENTMTSIWTYLVPDSTRAVIEEGLRNKRNTIERIIQQNAEGFDDESLERAKAELDEFEKHRHPAARRFDQLCEAILGGSSIYVTWRVMSSYSHAQLPMADFYLKDVPQSADNVLGVELNPDPEFEPHEAWLGTAVCMLITILKVCDNIDSEGRRKTQLDRAAKKMGISLDFKLVSDEQ